MRTTDHLDEPTAAAVLALAARAERSDGAPPLSEDARLALRAPAGAGTTHLLTGDDTAPGGDPAVTGYARLSTGGDGRERTLELVVDPDARGRGLGAQLAGAAAAPGGPLLAWAHGDLPGARALAARGGWRAQRELWRMERELGGPEGPGGLAGPAALPDGVVLRAFEVGRDEDAWLDLNSRAFASHPEQGRWGRGDLAARQAEPWFDPAGLLLAVDEHDGRLLASHWTKVEPHGAAAGPTPPAPLTGEVYVVAVDPAAQGRGLGRAVVLAGLHHLAGRGASRAELYVDGDNGAARALYARLGFTRAALDVQYALVGGDAGGASGTPSRRNPAGLG